MASGNYYVYFLTNTSRTLYIGITNDIRRRLGEHRDKRVPGFTAKYNISQLVYYEQFSNVRDAIAAEKRYKGWTRRKKIELIESMNPHWEDLGIFGGP
ncbi:GIY-YIG nuclease family protein [bacterium]|nr:GIY-YIG nuclease family protein [bacterium]